MFSKACTKAQKGKTKPQKQDKTEKLKCNEAIKKDKKLKVGKNWVQSGPKFLSVARILTSGLFLRSVNLDLCGACYQ